MKLNTKENQKILASFIVGALITLSVTCFHDRNVMKIDLTNLKTDKTTEVKKDGVVVAKINGDEVTADEVNKKLAEINPRLSFNNLRKEEKELILKEILAQRLVLKNALKNKSYKEYSPTLQRFAIEETKSNYLEEEAKKQISDEQVKAKYDEVLKAIKGKKEFLVSHILTKDKALIDQAAANLKTDSFEDTAKKFSVDSSNAKNGGKLGYIVAGSTMPEFDSQIKRLGKGETSQPFKTALGWHIVKVSDVREVVPAKFDDVKDKIKESLAAQSKKVVATKLIENAKIEIL